MESTISLNKSSSQSSNFHPGKSYPGSCKPSITEVIGSRVQLRRAGKEFVGLCPFHADKAPSFSVSEEKGLFHCFGCGESGDVFDFIGKLEGIGFREAKARLGVTAEYTPKSPITAMQRRAAAVAAAWMAEQRRKVNVLLGEVLEQIDLCDELGDSELAESFLRERSFLHDLHDDLDMSRNAVDLLSIRPMIEAITEGVEL
jgi:DNA primase